MQRLGDGRAQNHDKAESQIKKKAKGAHLSAEAGTKGIDHINTPAHEPATRSSSSIFTNLLLTKALITSTHQHTTQRTF